MGNEIFEEIKKKYEKTKKFSYVQQDSFYVDKSFFKDMGKLIQIIETMNKRKLQNMTFEYFNDNELQSIVSQYLTDFLKEIIKRDYISKKKLNKKIEDFKIIRDTIIQNEKELNRPMMTYYLKRNDYCIKMLESLLKGEE